MRGAAIPERPILERRCDSLSWQVPVALIGLVRLAYRPRRDHGPSSLARTASSREFVVATPRSPRASFARALGARVHLVCRRARALFACTPGGICESLPKHLTKVFFPSRAPRSPTRLAERSSARGGARSTVAKEVASTRADEGFAEHYTPGCTCLSLPFCRSSRLLARAAHACSLALPSRRPCCYCGCARGL